VPIFDTEVILARTVIGGTQAISETLLRRI